MSAAAARAAGLRALAQAAAQEANTAAQALRRLTETICQDDPTVQAHAARLSVALIAAAADVLSADALNAWAQDALPFIIPDARLAPPDAPPIPSPPIPRRWDRR
jgi:hypothetical protein